MRDDCLKDSKHYSKSSPYVNINDLHFGYALTPIVFEKKHSLGQGLVAVEVKLLVPKLPSLDQLSTWIQQQLSVLMNTIRQHNTSSLILEIILQDYDEKHLKDSELFLLEIYQHIARMQSFFFLRVSATVRLTLSIQHIDVVDKLFNIIKIAAYTGAQQVVIDFYTDYQENMTFNQPQHIVEHVQYWARMYDKIVKLWAQLMPLCRYLSVPVVLDSPHFINAPRYGTEFMTDVTMAMVMMVKQFFTFLPVLGKAPGYLYYGMGEGLYGKAMTGFPLSVPYRTEVVNNANLRIAMADLLSVTVQSDIPQSIHNFTMACDETYFLNKILRSQSIPMLDTCNALLDSGYAYSIWQYTLAPHVIIKILHFLEKYNVLGPDEIVFIYLLEIWQEDYPFYGNTSMDEKQFLHDLLMLFDKTQGTLADQRRNS